MFAVGRVYTIKTIILAANKYVHKEQFKVNWRDIKKKTPYEKNKLFDSVSNEDRVKNVNLKCCIEIESKCSIIIKPSKLHKPSISGFFFHSNHSLNARHESGNQ